LLIFENLGFYRSELGNVLDISLPLSLQADHFIHCAFENNGKIKKKGRDQKTGEISIQLIL
jgi:hypothetical protein